MYIAYIYIYIYRARIQYYNIMFLERDGRARARVHIRGGGGGGVEYTRTRRRGDPTRVDTHSAADSQWLAAAFWREGFCERCPCEKTKTPTTKRTKKNMAVCRE
jgi:hypothetical protein